MRSQYGAVGGYGGYGYSTPAYGGYTTPSYGYSTPTYGAYPSYGTQYGGTLKKFSTNEGCSMMFT